MRSPLEPASALHVLMRMPDLTPGRAKGADSPQREVYEQKPLAPLATLPADPPKPHIAYQPATPEELRPQNKFARPLAMLAGLAVVAILLVAVTNHLKKDGPSPDSPEDQAARGILGGSPAEITQAPEISFPTETPLPAAEPKPTTTEATSVSLPETMKIERLPAIDQQTRLPPTDDGSTAQVSDGQPGVARLDRGIESPKPQASYDSPRQGIY